MWKAGPRPGTRPTTARRPRPRRTSNQTRGESPAALVQKLGGKFSRELGINPAGGRSAEIFKWFLASVLFGARISETIAVRTYREFEKEGLLDPERIVARGWDGLVAVLDAGGYVRYDFKTATKLLDVCRALVKNYGGDLNALHAAATGTADLQERLRALGKGIGEVTVNIFLRELRGVWSKAEPVPSDLVLKGAKDLGLIPRASEDRRRALALLKERWVAEGNRPQGFADFEAALLRWGLALRRQTPQKRRSQENSSAAPRARRIT
jgi:endonuclease III